MATTNFEGYSHEQLLAMIASVNPETVKARATQLAEAATVIKEIGSALKKHQVKGWEGEAAHAFQEWVSRAGNATLLLGDYSEAGGKWMTQAAQTMIEVKANTPKYDTSAAENLDAAHKFHNDPDAQQLGRTAHTKLTADHQQAVQQLTKLAQSYEQSSAEMNKATVPTFPAPPPDFVPPIDNRHGAYLERPGAGAGPADSGAGGAAYGPSPSSPSSGAPLSASGSSPAPRSLPDAAMSPAVGLGPVVPDRGPDVELDHVATLPDKVLPLAPSLPTGPEL
ncbi:hypothetical protein [Streptomyces sp. W1SF4]|uniref:WXG100 family type VII secretion target n=1 Tax=Streptomyces sp. W1SF4 TaxID=2305220 RepID=UPI000F715D9D|nr:hypothetical protein [Streptomyces sp. W1SF4]AZM89371.1 hypothetical protein D1J60_13485 [Streptomyces sp. W1SF4]